MEEEAPPGIWAVGRSENMRGITFPLVRIGLADLPKFGGGGSSCPSGSCSPAGMTRVENSTCRKMTIATNKISHDKQMHT